MDSNNDQSLFIAAEKQAAGICRLITTTNNNIKKLYHETI
jgi:hypothetical protein